MKAEVIYREAVLWDKPGGNHHKAFLHLGDEIEICEGWSYSERKWKDKRFLKACAKGKIGYIYVGAITPLKEKSNATDNSNKKESWNEEDWFAKAAAVDM